MEIKVENLRPVANNVVIRPLASEKKTSSGVYIPKEAERNNHTMKGEVVAAGKGMPDCPMDLKVGEIVLYPKHSGTEISGGLIIMKETQVLTVI